MTAYSQWLASLPGRYSKLQDKYIDLLGQHQQLLERHEQLQAEHIAALTELLEWKRMAAALTQEMKPG